MVPVRNGAAHLERAVTSILAQDYPTAFDVCLAVGPSDDGTATLAAAIAADEQRVTVVDNPTGVTPAGLNAGIAATTGSVIVRVDGHAALPAGYIRRAAGTMCRTGAVNVGGMQVPTPESPFEEAVAAATTSWMGTGGATYRVGGAAGPVDTVYLGVFDRAAGDAVGWFDEALIRNQDYELNIRLRDAGGTVWFDPDLCVSYRPRGTWKALATQYFEYGYWKAAVVRLHPDSVRLRQLAPIAALAGQAGAIAGFAITGRTRWLSAPLVYLGALIVSAGRDGGVFRTTRTVLAAWTMHQAWALGALTGTVRRPYRGRSASS